jgi:hypothetical protein
MRKANFTWVPGANGAPIDLGNDWAAKEKVKVEGFLRT